METKFNIENFTKLEKTAKFSGESLENSPNNKKMVNYSKFSIAVKAFIINDGEVLIIKRASDDIHKPGIWEIPGGRIDEDESMESALKREVLEETGLDIRVNREISVKEFTRDDSQETQMHIFLCNAISDKNNIKLSNENTSFEWTSLEKIKKKLTDFFYDELDILSNLDNERWP